MPDGADPDIFDNIVNRQAPKPKVHEGNDWNPQISQENRIINSTAPSKTEEELYAQSSGDEPFSRLKRMSEARRKGGSSFQASEVGGLLLTTPESAFKALLNAEDELKHKYEGRDLADLLNPVSTIDPSILSTNLTLVDSQGKPVEKPVGEIVDNVRAAHKFLAKHNISGTAITNGVEQVRAEENKVERPGADVVGTFRTKQSGPQ